MIETYQNQYQKPSLQEPLDNNWNSQNQSVF